MNQRYDDAQGRATIDKIMSAMRDEAIAESEHLGSERGVYPVYQENAAKMPHAPRRNVAVLTVAPTGTTSMLMGVSSGIEPVFSPFIWRKIGAEYKALIAPLFQEILEEYPAHPAYARDGRWDWGQGDGRYRRESRLLRKPRVRPTSRSGCLRLRPRHRALGTRANAGNRATRL